jgi:hypothetical protein
VSEWEKAKSKAQMKELNIVHVTPCCGLEWTRALRTMDGKWSGNSFLWGSSSLANHGGWISYLFLLPAC